MPQGDAETCSSNAGKIQVCVRMGQNYMWICSLQQVVPEAPDRVAVPVPAVQGDAAKAAAMQAKLR